MSAIFLINLFCISILHCIHFLTASLSCCVSKLMIGKSPRTHSLHGKTAASGYLKLFISGNERCQHHWHSLEVRLCVNMWFISLLSAVIRYWGLTTFVRCIRSVRRGAPNIHNVDTGGHGCSCRHISRN